MTAPDPATTDPTYGTPTTTASSSGRTLGILSIVFGAIAFLFLPIVLGPAGIVCGALSMRRGERLGKIGLAVSIAGLVIGLILGAVAFNASKR